MISNEQLMNIFSLIHKEESIVNCNFEIHSGNFNLNQINNSSCRVFYCPHTLDLVEDSIKALFIEENLKESNLNKVLLDLNQVLGDLQDYSSQRHYYSRFMYEKEYELNLFKHQLILNSISL